MKFDLNVLETGKFYEFTNKGAPVFACHVVYGDYPHLVKSADGTEITLVDQPDNIEGFEIIEITEEKFNEYQRGFN